MQAHDPNLIRFPLALCAAGFLALPATADIVEIAQESAAGLGDFDTNVLGLISTVDTFHGVVDHYSYSTPEVSSYNGPAPLAHDGVSQVFVHRSMGLGTISLVVVHDRPNDTTGGQAQMRIVLQGDPDGAEWLVKDDPSDTQYTGAPGDSLFSAVQTWAACCTDGFALGNLDGLWSTELEFTALPGGLFEWFAYSGNGAYLPLTLEPNRRVRLRVLDVPPAFSHNYGFGHPGTLGVPELLPVADAVLGKVAEAHLFSSMPQPAPALLLVGLNPNQLPTPWGGVLLLDPMVVQPLLLPPAPEATPITLPMEIKEPFFGVSFYSQALILDPGASHGISFTPGLRMQIGS